MSDTVMPFPNLLQPTNALKTYAPVGVKFWQGEDAVLDGMKEFADGWFARRHAGTRAALETARRIGDAATPLDVIKEYNDWFGGAVSRMMEDSVALQKHLLQASARVSAHLPVTVAAEQTAAPPAEERRAG